MATGLPARALLVCAVLWTASGGGARGDSTPGAAARRPVAVVDVSADPAAQAVVDALNGALAGHPALQPVGNVAMRALAGPFVDEDRPALDAANQARTEAIEALARLDHRAAAVAVERGERALHDARPTADLFGVYAALELVAGQVALRQRRPGDAALAFALSHRLDPTRPPDPARYEPDVVEAYLQASRRAGVSARLEVRGTGTVWIDGVDRGPAPGTFEVPDGAHLVQLSGAARQARGQRIRVPEVTAVQLDDAPASESRRVERARAGLAAARDAAERAAAMRELATLIGVGDVVLVERSAAGAIVAGTWRDRAPGFTAPVAAIGAPPAELLSPLAPSVVSSPSIGPSPSVVSSPSVGPSPSPPVGEPLVRQRWFQGAVAVGFVGVVASVLWIATRDRALPDPNPDIGWKP